MNTRACLDLAPAVFQKWANYWRGHNFAAPPLVVYRQTLSGAIILVAPVAAPWVRDFVESHASDLDVLLESQGETLTEGNPRYLGTWAALSATFRDDIKPPAGRPVLPAALPRIPDVHELKRRWLA